MTAPASSCNLRAAVLKRRGHDARLRRTCLRNPSRSHQPGAGADPTATTDQNVEVARHERLIAKGAAPGVGTRRTRGLRMRNWGSHNAFDGREST